MVQPNFINPVHHASVDLSGHNLVNAHQASGMATCGLSCESVQKQLRMFSSFVLCVMQRQAV